MIFSLIVLLVACEPKPEACLEMDEIVEAGTTLHLESCSDNYDFLTWEFSDERGYVSEQGEGIERQLEDQAELSVLLTAYSDGGYRSDAVYHVFKTSFRYIDRFEIIGLSEFDAFIVEVKNDEDGSWSGGGATGEFTESNPFVMNLWPSKVYRLPNEQKTIQLFGRRNGSRILLGEQQFNFATFKENPTVFNTNGGYTVELHWRFRD